MVNKKELGRSAPWHIEGVPALVAHRGYALNYPENTLLALSAAVEAGAHFIELDIQLSKDGVPFLTHDDNFQRTAGLDLNVFETSIAEIERISVGEPERFGDRFSAEKPIRLEALCRQLNQWQEVHSFIEIKKESVQHFGLEKTVGNVLNAIDSLQARHTLISFSYDVVDLVQKISTRSAGWIISQWNDESLKTLQELSPDFVFCNYKKIPEDISLPNFGGKWALYDFDDPMLAKKWFNRGADLIETMAVQSMVEALSPEKTA